MSNPVAIDYTLVAQILAFLLLFWLLSKYAWNPLLKVMEERRTNIDGVIKKAEAERRQAEEIKREYQAEMLKARQEAQEIISRATKVSEERAAEILALAREEGERLKKTTLADIERERERAIADIRTQVAELSVAVAAKIIQQNLNVQGQEQLIEQFIQEVGDMPC